MQKLIGVCQSGLGDRMILMWSIAAAARLLNRCPHIMWIINSQARLAFDTLFENRYLSIETTTLQNITQKKIGKHMNSTDMRAEGDIVVDTFNFVYIDGVLVNPERGMDAFSIREEVVRAVPNIPPDTLGIHVRRGDVTPTQHKVRYIYTDTLIEAARTELKSGAYSQVLICTDDPREVDTFRRSLGAPILYFSPASLDRNTERANIDAMRDLLMLSKCKVVIGGSSMFARAANFLGRGQNLLKILE